MKDVLNRLYSALTVGALTGIAMLRFIWTDSSIARFFYIDIGRNMLLALGICWIATRQNKPTHFKWYMGIMFVLTFLYIYLPRLLYGLFAIAFTPEIHLCLGRIMLGCYWVCIIISSYLSNTKYYNVFPNQNKGISILFRILSWIGQIIVWGYLFLLCLSVIGIIE